ncbi:MAG: hypothetical protein HKN73_09930 [Gemmatimonadetes bacterium]|nr:hypothetical protein [Gemmatimonadota bacterium]
MRTKDWRDNAGRVRTEPVDQGKGDAVVLRCSYEEGRALARGTEVVLSPEDGTGSLLAPPVEIAAVESLARRLNGDLSVSTYGELEGVESALAAITDALGTHLDGLILATHPGGEEAVAAYFDYAHALTVLGRARELKAEMAALIELMTGSPVTKESAGSVSFPD